MAKVDWITWKTDIDELINPDVVVEEMDSYYQDYYTYMKPVVYEQIKSETQLGGLSVESFNISGLSPSNELALTILQKIEEINQVYSQLRSSIYRMAEEQRIIEKNQLIECINAKIDEEEKFIKDLQEQVDKQSLEQPNSYTNDILYIAYDRLYKLNDKLESIQSL